MLGLRRAAFALLGALATLVAATCLPAAASAVVNITIISAGADSTGNPYDFTIVASDGNGAAIQTMTARISSASNPDVADPVMNPVSTTDPASQTWVAAAPIAATAMPAGTYNVSVDANDGTETDPGLTASFSFSYTVTTVSVTPSQSSVSEGSQTVIFSGNVTGQATSSTPAVPIGGAEVDLSTGGGGSSMVTTTDSGGSFTYTVGTAQPTDYNFSVPGGSTYSAGNKDVLISASPASTSMTVTPNPATITQGSQNVTFTGTVMTTGGSPVPVPGAPVSVMINGGSSTAVTTTDSGGGFTYTVDNAQPTDYIFSIPGSTLYNGTSQDVTIGVTGAPTNMAITANPANVSQGLENVTFTGTVMTTGGSPVPIPNATVSLSIGGGSTSPVTTTDSNGGFSYTVDTAQPTDYNFSIPGSNLYNGTSQDVNVGAVAAPTTVTATPSATTVTQGSTTVDFSGTVTALPSGITAPVPVANAPVYVAIGTGAPTQVASTDGAGNFNWAVIGISATTSYVFSVPGSTLYAAGSTAPMTITAAAAATTVAVTPSPKTVTQGSNSVTFAGLVTAGPTAVPVAGATVDLAIGTGSVTAVATTASDGTFTATVSGIQATAGYTFSVAGATLYGPGSTSLTVSVTQATAAMAVTANPNKVGAGSQTVTFTGKMTALPAGTTAPVPVAGAPVSLAIGTGSPSPVTTTDSTGSFSYTLTGAQPNDYDFSAPATNLYTMSAVDVPVGLNQALTTLVVTPTPPSVTEGSQTVTFAGTITGIVPGGTTKAALQGVAVDLAIGKGMPGKVATTDSQGAFTATIPGISKAADYVFSVVSTGSYSGATDEIQVKTTQARTRITGITISPAHLRYGQKATIKGTVQYLNGKTWTSLGTTRVQVKVGANRPVMVRAGSNGSFAATMSTTRGAGWSTALGAGNLIAAASAGGSLTIQVPMKVRFFDATLGVSDAVAASGCVQVTVPYTRGPASAMQLQYSAGQRGPWKVLGRLQLHNVTGTPSWCRSDSESYFSGSIHAKLTDAYYRASFPVSFSFDSAVSQAIHASRTETRITSFAIRPASVSTGGKVTITGRLWHKGKSWTPYGHRKIEFLYNEKGTDFWGKLGFAYTNANGDFSQTALGGAGRFVAVIYAEYTGSNTDLAVTSNGLDLSVNHGKGSAEPTDQLPAFLKPLAPDMAILASEAIQVKRELQRFLRAHHRVSAT
jgi:hypothetical protein